MSLALCLSNYNQSIMVYKGVAQNRVTLCYYLYLFGQESFSSGTNDENN